MMLLEVLFYLFIVVVCIQVVYYLFIFSRFAFSTPNPVSQKNIAVSILICAKNEAENLKSFIPLVLQQDYPEYELVLINDASYDNSLEIMEEFAHQHDNIKIVNVENNEAFWANKKYALTLGIKAAKHDFLLFTDADCKPNSTQWLKDMSSHFSNVKTIVLGYGAYNKIKHSLLNKLIRFETVLTALQYFSYAKIGLTYMGVGRNLAYRKQEFFKANGYMNHMHIRSGDDDLLINEIATKTNAAICFTKNSFTKSIPKTSFGTWIKQKRRHISTASHYKFQHKSLLALFYSSQIFFWSLAIGLLAFGYKWNLVLALIILRLAVCYLIFIKTAKKLDEKDILWLLPFLEIFLIGTQLAIFITNLISKPKHWK